MDLAGPALGFVEMAAGMGVAGTRVTKPGDVADAIRRAFASGKPHVVEIAIEAKR
jgi:benzoylformate decarboxylase